MKKLWPQVKLGELLVPVSRPEPVDPFRTYKILGAHWYAQGLYTKDVLAGSEIQAARVYRVEKGDFVYNRLFGWKGSFAFASDENGGCYVSNEFPCFEVFNIISFFKIIEFFQYCDGNSNIIIIEAADGVVVVNNYGSVYYKDLFLGCCLLFRHSRGISF